MTPVISRLFGVYTSRRSATSRSRGDVATLLARREAVLLGGQAQGLKEMRWLRSMVRSISLRTPTLGSLIDAVRRGIGVGVIPDELVAGDSSLVRLCDCEAVPQKSLWLVMNQSTLKLARAKIFAEHVTEHLRQAATVAQAR